MNDQDDSEKSDDIIKIINTEKDESTSQSNIPNFVADSYIESDSNSEDETVPNKKEDAKPRGSAKLTPQFKGLIGEANLRFVRGDIETAQKMCFEVIRQVPNAHEPYLTLANIFENSDPAKCKSYLTIASYINASNSSTWCRLAELSSEEGNYREAIAYYTKALISADSDLDIHFKRLALAQLVGELPLIKRFKTFLIKKMPIEEHEKIIQIASEIAKQYHDEKKYTRALEVLEVPFKRIPQNITQDLINMMLELLLITQQYAQSLDIFVQFCNFKFELNIGEDESISISSFSMPENVQVDIKCKFIVCAIKLKSYDVIAEILNSFLVNEEVEIVGDLFIDICEALVSENLHAKALNFYVPLTKSKNFSLAAVWLKFAECLVASKMFEQAVEAYFTVIAMAPQHIEVLTPLAELLLTLDKKEEALQVMSYHSSERLNVGVLVLRLKLLRQINALDEYWSCVELLLSRHCLVFKTEEEVLEFLRSKKTKFSEHLSKLALLRERRDDHSDIIPSFSCVNEIEPKEEMQLLREILGFALEQKCYFMLQKISIMALTSKRFEPYHDEISLIVLLSCLFNKDVFNGYSLARDLLVKYPKNNYILNLFAAVVQLMDETRHNRFIERLQKKDPEKEGLDMIDANLDIFSGFFHNAMRYYIKEFKETGSPFLSFMLGVILLQLSSQRTFTQDFKIQLFETSSYLFLNYARHRSLQAAQEINYNLGRMYQHLGIMYLAEHYYKKVLDSEDNEEEEIIGLKYEAAYNLHILYKNSNNTVAALQVLTQHLTI